MDEDLIRQAYARIPRPEMRPYLATRVAATPPRRRAASLLMLAYWMAAIAASAWILPSAAGLVVLLVSAPVAGLVAVLPPLRDAVRAWAIPLLRDS
jgi:hypothetical protein